MQRTSAVKGNEIGDVDQRVDRPKADGGQPLLQPFRRRAVFHAFHQPQSESGAQRRRRAEIERDLDRTGERAFDLFRRVLLEFADISRAEVARDAVDAGAIGTVRREIDLDHRFVEAGIFCVGAADRRVRGQLDDAVVIVRDQELSFRHQHTAAFDAADGADAKRDVFSRNVGTGRREHADHAGACIGRAAHDLHRLAVACVDHADAQAVGIRMLFGLDHPRDGEGREQFRLVFDFLDLKADHGQLVRDRRQAFARVEMLFEPIECELHGVTPTGRRRASGNRAGGSRNVKASAHPPRRTDAGRACRI